MIFRLISKFQNYRNEQKDDEDEKYPNFENVAEFPEMKPSELQKHQYSLQKTKHKDNHQNLKPQKG